MAQQYFVLGIGGTGMRCIESPFIYVLWVCLMIQTYIFLALDTDKDNGNFCQIERSKGSPMLKQKELMLHFVQL